jgi:hypothetical protein
MTYSPRRLSAFAEGFAAFNDGRGDCPYAYGDADHGEWWRGWQTAAETYLLAEFAKAEADRPYSHR